MTLTDLLVLLLVAGVCGAIGRRSEEHTSELQSQSNLVCRLLLEKKKKRHSRVVRRRGTALIFDGVRRRANYCPRSTCRLSATFIGGTRATAGSRASRLAHSWIAA